MSVRPRSRRSWSAALLCLLPLLVAPPDLGASPSFPEEAALLEQVHRDLETSDTRGAFLHLKRLYELHGAPCSDLLPLVEQDSSVLLSRYGSDGKLTQSRLLAPGQGYAYWERWARALGSRGWNPRERFPDELAARRVGNLALVGILAHELAHHLAEAHRVNPEEWALRELLADQISLRLLRRFRLHPELARLLEEYRREIAGALREATPPELRTDLAAPGGAPLTQGDLAEASRALPQLRQDLGVAPYVTLQLQRQAVLLDAPGLSSLEEFFTGLLATRPGRIDAAEKIEVRTVPAEEVPLWLRPPEDPTEVWDLDPATRTSLAATVLATDPAALSGAERSLVRLVSPERALWLIESKALSAREPVHVLEIRRRPRSHGGADLSLRLLGRGDPALRRRVDLLPLSGGGAALTQVGIGKGGMVLNWWETREGALVPGPHHGTRTKPWTSADGPLGDWPLNMRPGHHLPTPEGVVVALSDRLLLVREDQVRTLAGGLGGHRDGVDPRRVRLSYPLLQGLEGRRLWFTSQGREGRVWRWMSW